MLSVRLPAALARRLETLAALAERPKSFLVVKAIEEYVLAEEALLAALEEGEADARAGRTVSHRRVAPWLSDLARGVVRQPPAVRKRARK